MTLVNSDLPIAEFFDVARASRFTRMPGLRPRTDSSSSGIINVFYVLSSRDDTRGKTVADFLRPPLFIPEEMPVDDIFPRLRRSRQPMCLVTQRGRRGRRADHDRGYPGGDRGQAVATDRGTASESQTHDRQRPLPGLRPFHRTGRPPAHICAAEHAGPGHARAAPGRTRLALAGLACLYVIGILPGRAPDRHRRHHAGHEFCDACACTGRVTRRPYVGRRDGRVDYLSFPVDDGTGSLRVAAYRDVARVLQDANRLPGQGRHGRGRRQSPHLRRRPRHAPPAVGRTTGSCARAGAERLDAMIAFPAIVAISALAGAAAACLPGLHVYNVMGLLAVAFLGTASAVRPEILVAVCTGLLVAYAIVSAVPAVLLAAPDESAFFTVLPGQKLLMQGRGYEAVLVTAAGSLAGLYGLLLAAAACRAQSCPDVRQVLQPHFHWILWCVIAFMALSEWPKGGRFGPAGWRRLLHAWRSPAVGLAGLPAVRPAGIPPVLPLPPAGGIRVPEPDAGLCRPVHHSLAAAEYRSRHCGRPRSASPCRAGTAPPALLHGSAAGMLGGGLAAFFPV